MTGTSTSSRPETKAGANGNGIARTAAGAMKSGADPAGKGEATNPSVGRSGLVPSVSRFFTGEDSGDLAAMVFTGVISYPALLALCFLLPAPANLGGRWFSFACLVGASTIGVIVGGMFTPTSEGEAKRFGSLGSFVAGLGGAILLATVKDPLVRNLRIAVDSPQFTGPVYITVITILLAASITVVARKAAADRAMTEHRGRTTRGPKASTSDRSVTATAGAASTDHGDQDVSPMSSASRAAQTSAAETMEPSRPDAS